MKDLVIKPIRLSHSQKQAFLSCPRKWELRYNEKYTLRTTSDKKAMLLGSAFHYGIAEALRTLFSDGEFFIQDALDAVTEWYDKELVPNKMRYVPNGGYELDTFYYKMMLEVKDEASKLLRFYLPKLELGTTWVPASENSLFPDGSITTPLVEYPFEIPLPSIDTDINYGNVTFSGIIDAVMRNVHTGELFIFDWKMRAQFGYDPIAMLDDQLFIYAALLDKLGVKVDGVCMFQLRSKLPSPASISKAGTPNLGGENGFDTTKEHWIATLPMNVNAEQWLPKVAGKFKPISNWIHPVTMVVNQDVLNLTMLNLIATARMMLDAIARDSFAATLNTNVCKQCDFWRLCSGLQYGGNATTILEQYYEQKEITPDEEISSTDDGF